MLHPGALESVDRAKFLRDGYFVLPGAMTQSAAEQWRVAQHDVQAAHDAFLTSDWNDGPQVLRRLAKFFYLVAALSGVPCGAPHCSWLSSISIS